jgi:hypothetical protein
MIERALSRTLAGVGVVTMVLGILWVELDRLAPDYEGMARKGFASWDASPRTDSEA